jgi:hypothetical protein
VRLDLRHSRFQDVAHRGPIVADDQEEPARGPVR